MKPAKVYNHYIWIINTLMAYGSLTLAELSEKWQEDKMTDGNGLPRATFNRYRDAITKIFGIVIECDLETYKYYISNPNILNDDSIERWLFSSIAVQGVLAESFAVKDRVVLENVAAGLEYLQIIIKAIKTNRISIFNNPRLFGYNPAFMKCADPYENSKIPAKVWRLQKNFVILHTASIRCRYICPIATRIGTNL